MRILLLGGILAAGLAPQIACVMQKAPPPPIVFRMGDKARAGTLIYTVLGSEWLSKLGEGAQARVPSHRFLVVHLSVTNSGATPASPPALSLADSGSQLYNESMDGQDVPTWWGMIRTVQPGATLEGKILFDVEPKTYNLKLEDEGGDVAMVELPLQFKEGASGEVAPAFTPAR